MAELIIFDDAAAEWGRWTTCAMSRFVQAVCSQRNEWNVHWGSSSVDGGSMKGTSRPGRLPVHDP